MHIATGPIMQLGCVVTDLARAEEQHTSWFGVPEWTRFPEVAFGPDRTTYRGEPADYAINVSLGYAGDQQLELIEPIRGENLYTEFLDRCGPGVHHVAWIPDDYEAALAEADRRGLVVAQAGSTDDMEFVCLETTGMGAHFVELMRLSPRMAQMFESLRRAAAAS